MTTMIALVSEQRMQNIIPPLQLDDGIDHVLLLRSTDADVPNSKFARALRDTQAALDEMGISADFPGESVGAYGIHESWSRVSGWLRELGNPDKAVVNFTGGTKCMSIGAYQAAMNTGSVCVYVDTANEKIVRFLPNGQVTESQFQLRGRLKVRLYLSANGQQVDQKRTQKKALSKTDLDIARQLVRLWPACVSSLETLSRSISNRESGRVEQNAIGVEVSTLLGDKSYLMGDDAYWLVTQAGRSFVNGGWLEAMTRVFLEDSQIFDDVESNVCLDGVENELDGLAARNGQLAVIECKSGDLGGQTTLNKMQAIKTRCGMFARMFFVTSRRTDEVDHLFQSRAQEYGFRQIIAAEDLPQVAEIVKKAMRGVA